MRIRPSTVSLTLLACSLSACPKHQEAAHAPGPEAHEPASGTVSVERRAGTYDPRLDKAPATGPGAPGVGDVPGTGMDPIDHPIRPPEPAPAAPAQR